MAALIANDGDLDMLVEESLICAAVDAVLAHEGVGRDVDVSVSFVGPEEMRGLNAAWRGIDAPTDVLSFECDSPFDDEIPADEPVELGDVILCPEVIAAQAPEFDSTPGEECLLMLVHGMFHLLGYDHVDTQGSEEMETGELAVLRLLAEGRGLDPDAVRIGPMTRHLDD